MTAPSPELFVQRYIDEVTSHKVRFNSGTVIEMPGSVLPVVDVTDPTKRAFFSLSGNTTATDRTLTLPNATAYMMGAQFVYQTAAKTLANDTNLNALFTAAQDTLTVAAATTYLVDAFINLTTGATTHVTSFGLIGAGATTTFTSVNLFCMASSNATGGGLAAAQLSTIKVATAQAVTATSTAVDTHIYLRGSFQVNAGGTIIPSIQFGADPTGTLQTNIGSYFLVYPVGTNAVVSHGPWA